ncbi:MAG: hypothetical protein JSU75_07690 [Gammaproteobacteria bacterium]|nr:MAG: hypothetical protein JSU75_07690 [Gammaproteobacteria bacterium]
MHNMKLHRRPWCRMLVPVILVLLAGLLNPVSGQVETGNQPALYDVEVVVFRNRSPQSGGEQWPQHSPEAGLEPRNDYFRKPVDTGIEEMPRDQRSLQNVADSLKRSGAYDVLVHTRWRQAGLDRTLAQPYRVPHGLEQAGYRLEGTIRLVRERFLHLDIDLLLSKPQAAYLPGQAGAPPDTVYALQETRRVRSGERHYFDHPYLGVIATVVPYEPPELPVPVDSIRMEGSDPSVVGEIPAPGSEQDNTTTESLPIPTAPPGN